MRFEAFFDERPVPWSRTGGSGKRRFKPAALREYDATLVHWMREEAERCGWVMAEGDVHVHVTLHFAGAPPGDLDNYFKAITDAGNRVLYRDDKQISRQSVERKRGGQEGFWLRVTHAEPDSGWPA